MKKKLVVAKGIKMPKAKVSKIRKEAGSSNVGKYKDVAPSKFAGAAGDASKYSYPINDKSRAKSALKLAHNAPNPAGIKAKVYKMYPELAKKAQSMKRKKNHEE